jgi:hypothetical protein
MRYSSQSEPAPQSPGPPQHSRQKFATDSLTSSHRFTLTGERAAQIGIGRFGKLVQERAPETASFGKSTFVSQQWFDAVVMMFALFLWSATLFGADHFSGGFNEWIEQGLDFL